jgi:epoxyqueuosine reductase
MTRDDIDRLLRDHGVALWGVAANDPPMTLAPGLPRAISLAVRHDPVVMPEIEREPTEAYYADYQRVNGVLDAAAAAFRAALAASGHRAEMVPATIYDYEAVEDWGDAGVFAHKTAATRAGLGWIGKTALFVSPQYGPWLRLATVFTDLDLEPGTPVVESGCESCAACVDACPADAGRDVSWTAGMPRDALFDEKACELFTERYDDLDGVCGACLAVCPFGIAGAKE